MKLCLGIPGYAGRVSSGHLLQTGQLAWAFAKANLPPPMIQSIDSCDLAKSRNLLLYNALQAGQDMLLTCDADTYWPGQAQCIAQMLAEGTRRQAAVIAAPYKMRKRSGYPVSIGEDSGALLQKQDFDGKVIEVDRIATGFMAINLNWIRACWPTGPWFQFEQLPTQPPTTVGEDYWFCRMVRERGGLILADGRFEPIHVGACDESGWLAQLGVSVFEV